MKPTMIPTLTPLPTSQGRPSKAPPPHDERLIEQVTRWLAINELSQNQLAKQLAISSAQVSQWLDGKYPGDVAKMEALIREHIHTTALAMKAEALIATTATRTAAGALMTLQRTEGITVLYGPHGAGRSAGATLFAQGRQKVALLTVNVWSGTVAGIENALMDTQSRKVWQRSNLSRGAFLAEKLKDTHTLLIFDGADRLSPRARKWLLDFNAATGCPMCFIIGPDIEAFLASSAEMAERVGCRQRIALGDDAREAGEKLAAALLPELAAHVADVAATSGSLRKATAFAALARDMMANGRAVDADKVAVRTRAALGIKTTGALALEGGK